MLIGFTTENYRSFLQETSLSMVATADKEHREFNVIHTEHEDLLKNILIYGANASGKSNLIQALHYMKQMVGASFDVQTELIKSCQPFTFRYDAKTLPTRFEISFLLDDVVYDYGFEILNGQINKEYLYKKAQRRTLVFERTAPSFESIKITADMDDVASLKKNVRGDVLFLTWAAYTNNALAIKVVDWISKKLIILGAEQRPAELSKSLNTFVQDFVRKADSDIIEMKVQRDGYYSSHNLYGSQWQPMGKIDVAFGDYSSEGTKRMFELSDAFASAIEGSATIVIDEMDLHLHPALVRHLIAIINSIKNNPNNAQLICTTHDVLLLDEDVRRDQIWFVDKDEHGVSNLYALSDFKDVRKNSDILKRYLLGVYGAIPNLDGGESDV